jgi:hypothetical protein
LTARKRTVVGASRFLVQQQGQLLDVARLDVQALQSWEMLVHSGQAELEQRYQREYLTGEKFRGFDEALVRLIQLLDFPGIGQVVSGALYVLRTPYRLLRGIISKAVTRPEAPGRPEQPILEEAFVAWIDLLRRETARRAGEHPLWDHIGQGFGLAGLAGRAQEQFAQIYRSFQAGLALEVDRTARAIYEELEKKPVLLNSLRGSKLAIDVAAIGGTLVAGGISWHDIILVPLVASFTHQLVEILGKQVVDAQREQTRTRQQQLMHQLLAVPMAEWLIQWPSTGGSDFERLQLALRRIPASITQMEARIRQAVGAAH